MEAQGTVSSKASLCVHNIRPHVHVGAVPRPETSRRIVNIGSITSFTAFVAANVFSKPRQAQAVEGGYKLLAPGTVGRFVELPDGSGWQLFETVQFQIEVPPGYGFIEPPAPLSNPAAGRGRGSSVSAVKATFVNSEMGTITVNEYSASQIKPTLFQLSDISQFGSLPEVARLLMPPQARVVSMDKETVEQPVRDTGTLLGTVSASPQTLYRFEYLLPSGKRISTAAVARAGKVLLAGSIATSEQWSSQAEALRRSIKSFRLSFPT